MSRRARCAFVVQGGGGDSRLLKLLRGAGCRRKALDFVAVSLRRLPDRRERCGLAATGDALQAGDAVVALE